MPVDKPSSRSVRVERSRDFLAGRQSFVYLDDVRHEHRFRWIVNP